MDPNLVVTSCHWNRPDYTRQCLEWLARCDGIATCSARFHCDPGCLEVQRLLNAFDACPAVVTINVERLNCNGNTLAALSGGFAVADFLVHVEDDVLLAQDALTYFAWARDWYRDHADVLAATGFNRVPARGGDHDVFRRKWFHPWGWGTWRDRWQVIQGLDVRQSVTTWDTVIHRSLIEPAESSYREVYPDLSRTQNIGSHSSIHDSSWFTPDWHQQNQHSPRWAGQSPPSPGEWRDCGE